MARKPKVPAATATDAGAILPASDAPGPAPAEPALDASGPAPDLRRFIVEWRLGRLFTAPPVVMARAHLTDEEFAELLADPMRKVGPMFLP